MDVRAKYYGRKTSRSMGSQANNIFDTLYEKYQFLPQNYVNQPQGCVLEIGFGLGDFLAHQAISFPDQKFIGVEPFKTGVVSLLKKVQQLHIQNICIHYGVIYDVLDKLPSLKAVYILYPDPWPKKRHHKRRVVQKQLLQVLIEKLEPNGLICIASDHPDYQEWIKEITQDADLQAKGLAFDLSKIHVPFDCWVPTKYEKKAIEEGRHLMYFHGAVCPSFNKLQK